MEPTEAFKLYLAIRISFLNGYAFVKFGYKGKNIEKQVMKRSDVKLIHFILKKADSPNKLLRLCVGNFLHGNDNFLYSESFTDQNYKKHVEYMKTKSVKLQEDLDIFELRHYTHNGIGNYLSSQEAINDLLSCKTRIESYCLINQVHNWFIPKKGFMSDKIVERITNGKQFIPLCDTTKSIIENSWLNSIGEQ
jgi:hypothetical protein